MAISLGSLGALTGNQPQSSPTFRLQLSGGQSGTSTSSSSSSNSASYSSLALSSTTNSIGRKVDVLDSQINETDRLLEIANQIQSSRYDGQTATLRADATARISSALAAYASAAANDPSINSQQSQNVNTAVNYDPDDTEDAVIVTIGSTSSPTEAGLGENLFVADSHSIEETITALQNVKSRFESERAAISSTGTAVAAGNTKAEQRVETIKESENKVDPVDPEEAIREAAEQILADGAGSDAAITSNIVSLLEDATSSDDVESEDDENEEKNVPDISNDQPSLDKELITNSPESESSSLL